MARVFRTLLSLPTIRMHRRFTAPCSSSNGPRDRRAVLPLCKIADAVPPGAQQRGEEVYIAALARTLGVIGDPRALPSLHRLLETGAEVHLSAWALGHVGDKNSFAILFKLAQAEPWQNADCFYARCGIVRRSNCPLQYWMTNAVLTEAAARERLSNWTAWWQQNQSHFEIKQASSPPAP